MKPMMLVILAAIGCGASGVDDDLGPGGKGDGLGDGVVQCNEALFGVRDPGALHPLWAQDYVGSGLLRDRLLTAAERAVPVEIANTSENAPSPAFRALYPT